VRDTRAPSALTIAGSDSGGGAGIQADLKTFAAHGVHGLSAIAALTAQHTRGVTSVHVPELAFLRAQVEACFDDFDIRAVKLGMLATASVIGEVDALLASHRDVPLVLDPVMVATSGAKLLADDALDALRTRLLPRATIATPNLPEAELLLGMRIESVAAMRDAADAILACGARAVLLEIAHPRLALEAHGTGCTLASAIAARLALGDDVRAACIAASDYVHRALLGAYRPGRGDVVVLDHFGASR
jgi:hydroxymethylpyrimidine/phosphomethylpyrimidine kinase